MAGVRLAVFDTHDGVRAVENSCAHVGNPLDDGLVRAGVLRCPWHGWAYDLATGEHLTAFGRQAGIRSFPTRVEGDEVLVDLPEADGHP